MAKNNGTGSSAGSQAGRSRQGKRSRSRGNPRGSSARRSSSSRKRKSAASSASASRKSTMLDAVSPIGRGFSLGRRRGRTAVESIKSVGSRAVETVGEHPIPVALIGAGLTWLLLETRGLRPTDSRIIGRSRDAIGGLGGTIAETAGTAGRTIADAVSSAAEGVAEGVSSVGEYVSDAASTVRKATSRSARTTRQTLDNLWEQHPVAMSAAIVTAGVAVGMLLPVTARESELLGGPVSNIVKRARRTGSQLLDQGRRLAATSVKAARREGERQGLTAGEIVHKVKRVVRSGSEAITE